MDIKENEQKEEPKIEDEEKLESDLASLLEKMKKDKDLGEAIKYVFDNFEDINEIQARVILLVKKHLIHKLKPGLTKAKLSEKEEKEIEKDIEKISYQFMDKIIEDVDHNLGTIHTEGKKNILDHKARKTLERIMKNFAIYEVYKVMNPRRIAGETGKQNYINNLVYKGEKHAGKYEGGKPSDLKSYGEAEVAGIKRKVAAFKKNDPGFSR